MPPGEVPTAAGTHCDQELMAGAPPKTNLGEHWMNSRTAALHLGRLLGRAMALATVTLLAGCSGGVPSSSIGPTEAGIVTPSASASPTAARL